jgi:hypothetical protein
MTTKRKLSRLASALVIAGLASATGHAQDAPVETAPALQAQLERLNKNIERIADLLEQSLAGQHLDLLMQRVEVGAGRLAVAEKSLRDAQATRSALDDEKLEIEARLAQMAEGLDSGTLDMPLEELEHYTRELDLQLQLLKERLKDADREIFGLESEVMRQREHIRDWQNYIDDELTSRQ